MSETKPKVATVKGIPRQDGTWKPNVLTPLLAGVMVHGDVEALGFGGRHHVDTVETS